MWSMLHRTSQKYHWDKKNCEDGPYCICVIKGQDMLHSLPIHAYMARQLQTFLLPGKANPAAGGWRFITSHKQEYFSSEDLKWIKESGKAVSEWNLTSSTWQHTCRIPIPLGARSAGCSDLKTMLWSCVAQEAGFVLWIWKNILLTQKVLLNMICADTKAH